MYLSSIIAFFFYQKSQFCQSCSHLPTALFSAEAPSKNYRLLHWELFYTLGTYVASTCASGCFIRCQVHIILTGKMNNKL